MDIQEKSKVYRNKFMEDIYEFKRKFMIDNDKLLPDITLCFSPSGMMEAKALLNPFDFHQEDIRGSINHVFGYPIKIDMDQESNYKIVEKTNSQ